MTLDREQWLHLARANAEILRADIEGLRGLITDGAGLSYAEFWAQARDLATKFKTFKPLEVEARETLWAEYRATCEATRALQDSERVHLHDDSRAVREHIEAELAKVLGMVEAATTVQELSKAQSLLDRVLNQMKTRRRQEPKKEAAEAAHPAVAEPAVAPAEPAAHPAEPEHAPEAEAVEAETAEAAGLFHPEEAAGELAEGQDQAAVAEALASEAAPTEEPAAEAEAPQVEAPAAAAAAPAPAQEPARPQLVLLRSDREACWAIWTKVREDLRAKRAAMRRELLEGILTGAQELQAASENDEPKAVQEKIRAAQAVLKESGLLPSEQDAVRNVLRTAWKRCSERIESTRTERQKAHKEWVERMSTHISRWEKQILRNQITAVQIQAEVADLESQAAGTHDEDKSSRLRRWIDGKRARLTELEVSSKEMEEKVHSVRVKMGKEAPEPITELTEEEIAALQQVRQSPPPERDRERRPRPSRDDRGGRGSRERDDRPKEPPTHPGLNLGELLAPHLKLVNGSKSE
jgi:hypothetical protein